MTNTIKPILFNISGPYAVGKDTVINKLIEKFPKNLYRVRTITTRPVSTEADPSYENVTFEELNKRTRQGKWLVNYQLSGKVAYGTSIDEIKKTYEKGLISIHSIYPGPEGAGNLRKALGKNLYSIGMLASHGSTESNINVLRERLIKRGRDDAQTIESRLNHQIEAINYLIINQTVSTDDGEMSIFDSIIINDSLSDTIKKAKNIMNKIFFGDTP